MRLIISEQIIAEISQVLNYPKLSKIYHAEGLRHVELIEAVLKVVKFVKVSKATKVVLEHSADDKYIECALEAKARYLVSGDKHLLKVGACREIQILTVSEFLHTFRS